MCGSAKADFQMPLLYIKRVRTAAPLVASHQQDCQGFQATADKTLDPAICRI
jgi:hypothetical protein